MFRLCVGVFISVSVLVGSARGEITAAQADFDGSGVVDIADFLQFVNAFGSSAGDTNFNAKYDLDGSGVVDIADFLQFVDVFGQTVQDRGSVAGDRATLIDFYHAIDGDNLGILHNWLSDKPLGEWYRVSTNAQGRVIGLEFNDDDLGGASIPEFISNLTKLERFRLSGCNVSGQIPRSIGKLTNLKGLHLFNNQLSGPIPLELGNLSNLRYLRLSDNQLSGTIPSSLGNLSNLQGLSLSDNQLSGTIPSSLGNLSNLVLDLSLSGNQLSGTIPSSLGNLSNLQGLSLSGNQLSGTIPSELGNLSKLIVLRLVNNQLSGDIVKCCGWV